VDGRHNRTDLGLEDATALVENPDIATPRDRCEGRGAESDDCRSGCGPELSKQTVVAGSNCGSPGVDWYRTARDRVDDQDPGYVNSGFAEGLAKELASPPHERTAQPDLLPSWRLADQDKR